MSSQECPRETCFWPDATCNQGHIDPSTCPVLTADITARQDDRPPPEAVAMPWSGGVLGLADLGFVAGRKKPTVLAIMGPENAGKTTLLGAWYLLLGRGAIPDDLRFSGSCSLAGWEAVASSLRWEPRSIPPSFPPHTSSRSTRVPGLLHLAFKRGVDHRRDYVMTDAPGEWFRNWAVNRDAPDAEGARWAAEHADVPSSWSQTAKLWLGAQRGAARTRYSTPRPPLSGRSPGKTRRPRMDQGRHTDSERYEKDAVRSAVLRAVPHAPRSLRSASCRSPMEREPGRGSWSFSAGSWTVRRPTLRLPEPAGDSLDPLFIFGAR